ncbi:MAG: HDOD domain-containing protein [candidate division Zixibacteria bacterium]|nr:HDOD domain-containing protein [candidate division Zixibacteria bacterium]
MNRLQIEARLAGLQKLSTLPELMVQIIRICEEPEPSLTKLSDVVLSDVALTARVLKVVNPPYYGQAQQVSSISRAVSTLGANRVKALALSLSLYDLSQDRQSSRSQRLLAALIKRCLHRRVDRKVSCASAHGRSFYLRLSA